jgi:hypothetical protein
MKFTNEQIKKAAACKSVDELIALAKAEGIELAKEEAQKFFDTLKGGDIKLDDLEAVTGGICQGEVCGANC